MIIKLLYATVMFGFVWSFASTTQLPRLILKNFIAAPAAQQLAPAEAINQQQKIKRAATSEANQQKTNIMPAQVSTPKPQQNHSAGQLGFMVAMGLLNLFVCYRLMRWIYRVFLRTPLNLLIAAFKFLIVKPYRFLQTPKIIARYEFMHAVPSSNERTVIVR
jgi:hypothetical protein